MSDIYIPKGAIPLDTPGYQLQLRLGLQGPSGTGKSHVSTTFDNPIFLSYDRGLISHLGRHDIVEIPFYDGNFVDSIHKRDGTKCPPARKEALIDFLYGEATKLTKNQTLVVDASNGVQTSYHLWWEQHKEEYATVQGRIDSFKEWKLKLDFFGEVMNQLKGLACNVIYIIHESPDRNDKGDLTGGVRPLLTGAFQDELVSHFTDWYRCHAVAKPLPEKKDEFKKRWLIDEPTYNEWMKSGTKETIYIWQTQSDNIAKCKTSLVGVPKYVLAHSSVFQKYQRKPEPTI